MFKTLSRILKILFIIIFLFTSLQFTHVNGADNIPVNTKSGLELIVMQTVGDTKNIKLRWSENGVSKIGYYIQRRTDNEDYPQGNSSIMVWYSQPASNAVNPMVNYSTTITGDTSGHKYTYRVIAVDSSSNSSVYTSEASFTFNDVAIPTSLQLTPVSATQIDLAWTYPNSGSFDTVIERKKDVTDSTWETLTLVPKNTLKYSDMGLTPNTRYFYRIRAQYNGNIFSQRFPLADSDNPDGNFSYTKLPTPIDLYGYAGELNTIKLTWINNYNGMRVVIERKKRDEQNFVVLNTINSDIGSYIDSNQISANNSYIYRIRAWDLSKNNYSDYSNEVTIAGKYIQEPTNLNASTNNDSVVELAWIDNSPSETGFEIWRKTGASGSWTNYDSVGRNVTEYVDRATTKDNIYFYRIRAIIAHSGAYSAFSIETKTWSSILQPPTNLKANFTEQGSINLSWKDNSNNETGFALERKSELEDSWSVINGALSENTTTYVDGGLSSNKKYYYRIKVYDNIYLNSYAYSDIILVSNAVPAAPKNLVAITSGSSVMLKWIDTSSIETSVRVEKKLGSTGQYYQTAELGPNTTSYLDTTVNQNSKYYFRVRIANNNSFSEYSNEVFVTTGVKTTYRDIKADNKAREAIENLAGMGVFNIPAGADFNPDTKITRGEFTSYLVKAFKLKASAVGSFTDVKSNHKYYKEIMIANRLGVVTQIKSNNFYPDKIIKRDEMAVLIVKAMKAAGNPLPAYDNDILNAFSDRELISSWALSSFASVVGEGILQGTADNGYQLISPSEEGDRAEAAMLIYRAIAN